MQTPTLCLNMIVKNESKIITRLFDSVLPIIDCYCICDTGSTDNTIQIILDYFTSKGIQGKVVIEPFKNFCHNRNFALKACYGMSDYVLLMDADMVLEVNNFEKKMLLTGDSFSLIQGSNSLQYQNLRIVKNDGQYDYCGVTHEYINTPSKSKTVLLDKSILFIKDYGDGGAKHDKYERDIRLLLDGIKEEPNNQRYYFYLANSYHDSGRFGEAINVYKKRIELGGWKEEVWYSYYRIGLCFKNMGKMDDAVKYWMEGFNYYPERLEGLYEIISHYRKIGKQNLANLFYQEAHKYIKSHSKNRVNYLFLHNDVYTYKLYYEYTIFSAYIGNKNINDEVINVLNNNTSQSENNNLFENMKFYKSILQPKTVLKLDNTCNLNLDENNNFNFNSSSSCLIKNHNNNGYKLNIRYVNYNIQPNGSYTGCDKHIITINKYVEFNNDFNIIIEKWMETPFEDRRYIGVEDVRIWEQNQDSNLKFIGTGYHKNDKIGIVAGKYNIENQKFEFNEIVPDFNNASCEKNWVFTEYNNKTHVIYKWNPLQICEINEENNILKLVEERKMPKIFSHVRGSSCGFTYKKQLNSCINADNIQLTIEEKEIWFITHLVSYENPRHYYHLIAVFDENMNLLRYSAPFKFEGESIEYSLSIVVEDDDVFINYSTWDRTTRIGVYDKKYIDSIVKYT
jgi:tetratricopeptide (TPR) repeat protein